MKHPAPLAALELIPSAGITGSAPRGRWTCNALTRGEARHSTANLSDDTHPLVPDGKSALGNHMTLNDVQITTTNCRRRDAYEDIAWVKNVGVSERLHLNLPELRINDGSH